MKFTGYNMAIHEAREYGVNLDQDYGTQDVESVMEVLAKRYKYRNPPGSNSTTARSFFDRLQRQLKESRKQ